MKHKKKLTKKAKKKVIKVKIEKEVRKMVKQYFNTVEDDNHQSHLHQELICRVERELLAQVIKRTKDNQSQAAKVLGISRTTLRKKLAQYNL